MSHFSAHWFDALVIIVLIVGYRVARYKEALPQVMNVVHLVVTWFLTLFLYEAPAVWLAKRFSYQPDVVALVLFPVEFLIVFLLLKTVRRRIAARITSKEPFGDAEVKIARTAGVVQVFVFLLIGMAWISGRYATAADIQEHKEYCQENFGGITYPVLCTINDDVFNGSYSGKFAKEYLSLVLMKPLPRVDYGTKEEATVAIKSTRKLRELDSNFEKDGKEGAAGKIPEGRELKEKEAAPQVAAQGSSGYGSHSTIYRDLTLKGVTGTGSRVMALINDQTFQAGESSAVKFEDRKITLQCIEIRPNSALVRLENKAEPFELKLGIATDLEGQPVEKN